LKFTTFGFPIDLSELIALEKGFGIDEKGFKMSKSKLLVLAGTHRQYLLTARPQKLRPAHNSLSNIALKRGHLTGQMSSF